MYLKRLEIQGFKSFAARTVLDFLPPKNGAFSITAIVGPNGSGKSNVTDAIRWAMGETSLKNIRGKKSEDVIFGGSSSRGALSAAEVAMTLDNADRAAPLDYAEVTITRRLYRSGESEYIVNNQPARLLDIHLLLAQAKFAEHAYSIVSQGMIDRLLTVTTAERKEWFDEASGIKEFQIKRHQAELKLARTGENIREAEVLIGEIEPRLKLLSKQVRKLEERQEIETQLRARLETYYASLFARNSNERGQLQRELQLVDERYRLVFQELTSVQNELATLARGATRQERFIELQRRHQEAVHTKNELERKLVIIEGAMHTEHADAGRHNVNWLNTKIKELRHKIEIANEQLQLSDTEIERVGNDTEDKRRAMEELVIERTEASIQLSRLKAALSEGESERAFSQWAGLAAVRAVLDARQRFGTIYGIVAELGEVAPEFRLALEVAAGQHLNSIVVADEKVARKAIEFLRQERLGLATFLPLNKITGRPITNEATLVGTPGVVGLAIDLVRFKPLFANIFSFIFGSTVIVEDLSVAERIGIGAVRMVTREGDVADKNGVMKGGFRLRKTGATFSSALAPSADKLEERRQEIKAIESTFALLEEKVIANQQALLQAEVAARTLAAKRAIFAEQLTALKIELKTLEQEKMRSEISPEAYGETVKELAQEQAELKTAMERAEEEICEAARAIERYNAEEEEKKQRVFALQQIMQDKQAALNASMGERSALNVEMAKRETKYEDLQSELVTELKVSPESLVERQVPIVAAEELPSIADAVQRLKYQLSLIGGIDPEVTNEYSVTKERFDFLSGQLKDLKAAFDDLTTMACELDELMKKKRGAAFKKIRKEFSRYFKILFEGGEADLEEVYGEPLTDEEEAQSLMEQKEADSEPAEKRRKNEKILTGIEIIANPPGKKIKYLNALSGGERTLTSIALICAILSTNPSPFVVLDEVEAALDEANTQRFVRIMTELSRQSQFIVITHNRVTMHAADALYGVVMKGDGVSQLLSVKLENAERLAEPAPVDKK